MPIVLAMILQQPNQIFEALRNACFIHRKSADLLIEDMYTVYDLMASDVIQGISKLYRTFLSE